MSRCDRAWGLGVQAAAWDADVMLGCFCFSSWPVGLGDGEVQTPEYFGPDCALRAWLYDSPCGATVLFVRHDCVRDVSRCSRGVVGALGWV